MQSPYIAIANRQAEIMMRIAKSSQHDLDEVLRLRL
jgi:hypothetical protein